MNKRQRKLFQNFLQTGHLIHTQHFYKKSKEMNAIQVVTSAKDSYIYKDVLYVNVRLQIPFKLTVTY